VLEWYKIERGCIMADGERIAATVPKEAVDKLDEIARKVGISRSALVRNLVLAGIKDLKLLERTGVISVVAALRNIEDSGIRSYRKAQEA